MYISVVARLQLADRRRLTTNRLLLISRVFQLVRVLPLRPGQFQRQLIGRALSSSAQCAALPSLLRDSLLATAVLRQDLGCRFAKALTFAGRVNPLACVASSLEIINTGIG